MTRRRRFNFHPIFFYFQSTCVINSAKLTLIDIYHVNVMTIRSLLYRYILFIVHIHTLKRVQRVMCVFNKVSNFYFFFAIFSPQFCSI